MPYDPNAKCTTCDHPQSSHTDSGKGPCMSGAGMLSRGCGCMKFTPTDRALGKEKASAH